MAQKQSKQNMLGTGYFIHLVLRIIPAARISVCLVVHGDIKFSTQILDFVVFHNEFTKMAYGNELLKYMLFTLSYLH